MADDKNVEGGWPRPPGLDGRSLAMQFGKDCVLEPLSVGLAKRMTEESDRLPLSSSSVEQGSQTERTVERGALRAFLRQIRLADHGDHTYWFVMLFAVLAYLVLELFLVQLLGEPHGLADRAAKSTSSVEQAAFAATAAVLWNFIYGIVTLLVMLALMLGCFLWAYAGRPRWLRSRGIEPSLFHSAPVLLMSLGILTANTYLVLESGLSSSPFLPGLLGICGLVIGLPRENRLSTVLVAVVGLSVGLFAAVTPGSADAWKAWNLAVWMNACSFGYGAALSILLRSVASYTPQV